MDQMMQKGPGSVAPMTVEKAWDIIPLEPDSRNPLPATVGLQLCGRVFGLGRDSIYAAAKNGEIHTMEFGRLKKVSVIWIARKLLGEV